MRKTGLDKLTERAIIHTDTVTADWNSGVATSGKPGADLFTYGGVGQWWRLTEAYLVLTGFNPASTVTIRCYLTIAGEEREMPEEDWEPAVDGALAYILWFWEIEIFGPFRVEVHSDQAADDGFAAKYEYRTKSW